MQKCLFKTIWGHNYFISEPIFKLFVALFGTHVLQISFNVFGLPPLHMQKCLFKTIWGHNYFISEPIFKLFVALFGTHVLQKDGMVIFFLWCFRKVRFRKMQFLKDGVQTVGLVTWRNC